MNSSTQLDYSWNEMMVYDSQERSIFVWQNSDSCAIAITISTTAVLKCAYRLHDMLIGTEKFALGLHTVIWKYHEGEHDQINKMIRINELQISYILIFTNCILR